MCKKCLIGLALAAGFAAAAIIIGKEVVDK